MKLQLFKSFQMLRNVLYILNLKSVETFEKVVEKLRKSETQISGNFWKSWGKVEEKWNLNQWKLLRDFWKSCGKLKLISVETFEKVIENPK